MQTNANGGSREKENSYKATLIYFNKFARYFGFQHKASFHRGLNGKSVKHKHIVRNKG